ncbi:MAG: hypothetical protein ACJAYI_001440 [Myxococcota bacterium]|jgi:hypothetical protein
MRTRLLHGQGTDKKVMVRLSDALAIGRRFERKAVNCKNDGTPFVMIWPLLPIVSRN